MDRAETGLSEGARDWLRMRDQLRRRRYELSYRAAVEYGERMTVAGQPLLTAPSWVLDQPLRLDEITLVFEPDTTVHGIRGDEPVAAAVLPARRDGRRYACYSEAMAALAAPVVFENRRTYRLLHADLSQPGARLAFGRGWYFDGIDTGEAAAHEYLATGLGPLRQALGDPCNLTRRPTNLAITTLTMRHDRSSGQATFWLHWRDPAKVGHAGGLYQLLPVGIFQPSSAAEWNEAHDFSLWRGILRELAEELLGTSEDYGSDTAPIDYENWAFAHRLNQARHTGHVGAFCLGLGVDPLTFATDLLTAVVIDAPVFDALFGEAITTNAEGRVLDAQPFTTANVERYARHEPMQAAGAALLTLADRHRATLLA